MTFRGTYRQHPIPDPPGPTWNVALPVVKLVQAPTAEDAIRQATRELDRAGFEIYEGGIERPDAFESDTD